MTSDRFQAQRFERKYFISERQAHVVREFLSGRLLYDEFSETRPDHSYPVHSLYLDSNELTTYWATVHCEKRRFKLRIRFYDDDPESPIFFEIKGRENECVKKQRGMAHRSAGPLLLAGQLPGPEHLISKKPQHLAALQNFCYLMQRLNARPLVHIAYEREAWVSAEGNSVRVTIDQNVRGEPRHEPIFSTRMRHPMYPFAHRKVLELKFTDRFPDWLGDMVRHLNLTQSGVPKYCGSVAQTGESRVVSHVQNALELRLADIARFC